MIVLCIVGTEEESGGDGAGEVSTGVESESVLRKRRPVVTGRLILLAGSPSIVFLRTFKPNSESTAVVEGIR